MDYKGLGVTIHGLRRPSRCGRRRSPAVRAAAARLQTSTTDTCAEKFKIFERINSIRETNGNFDSCNSCNRLASRLHESKFPIVLCVEFIRLKILNISAHVFGVDVCSRTAAGALAPSRWCMHSQMQPFPLHVRVTASAARDCSRISRAVFIVRLTAASTMQRWCQH